MIHAIPARIRRVSKNDANRLSSNGEQNKTQKSLFDRFGRMSSALFVSVIVPVHNARQHLVRCITAINDSTYRAYEVIVVDDASTDGSAEAAEAQAARVLRQDRQGGPAAARNYGAKVSRGDVLLFVDADVSIRADTLLRVVEDFTTMPDIAAVFGSYDDEPAAKNFLSQYKNLCHHFVHQHARSDATTFWAGCGAVRREVFIELGGFDDKRYRHPSIEDIELGYRMRAKGQRIYLDKELQVKHLKKWDLIGLLRADICLRAVPWTELILKSGHMPNDLNLHWSQKLSAGLVIMLSTALLLACVRIQFLFLTPILAGTVCLLNHRLYRFLIERRGLGFALRSVPMQFFYYCYGSVVFAALWLRERLQTIMR